MAAVAEVELIHDRPPVIGAEAGQKASEQRLREGGEAESSVRECGHLGKSLLREEAQKRAEVSLAGRSAYRGWGQPKN